MNDKNIIETTLIPFKVSDDLNETLCSMRAGIEQVVREDEVLHYDYLTIKGRQLFELLLVNWAISATAADQLEINNRETLAECEELLDDANEIFCEQLKQQEKDVYAKARNDTIRFLAQNNRSR